MLVLAIRLYLVLAGQLNPVELFVTTVIHLRNQGPHPAALGYYVLKRQRPLEIQQTVHIVQHKAPVLVGHRDRRVFDPGIGGADTSLWPHGEHEKQPAVAGKEGQYPVVRRDPVHHQVDTLGKYVAVFGDLAGKPIVGIHIGTAGIDQYP